MGKFSMEVDGYHGTDARHSASILENGFEVRDGKDLWYGPGAYFYGDAISDGATSAEKWAITQSRRASIQYSEFAVIKVRIRARKPFDVTTENGKKALNVTREKIRAEVSLKKGENEDNKIIKFLSKQLGFDVVINDCNARFEVERVYNIRSTIPNVRIIAVLRPETCIDKSSILIVKTGPIPPPLTVPQS
ncbi:hypothetical protein [Verrucomicrobium spinosum]|uniref:hypothetical protein n=2 Tax=Verrucomicrobium spinosum TaxID=2736 RepID=UPI0018DB0241|nr:hypothetical protein [Verrucomicrobium spinosum]